MQTLDLAVTAERHLLKQLVKTKRIAETPEFARLKNSTSVSLAGPKDTAEANVTARLFKSNPVKNAMPDIISGIRDVLGLDDAPAKKPGETGPRDVESVGKGSVQQNQRLGGTHAGSDDESDDEPQARNGISGDVSMDDAEEGSVDFAQFDNRLASSSEDSASEDASDSEMRSKKKSKEKRYDAEADLSLSASASASRSVSESPPSSKLKGRKKADGKEGPTKSTTFLPTLMGGYWSGSEEGGDDDDPADVAPLRKNRMGQQARRALWEKKYGVKANHLQQQKQDGRQNRDRGWDPRKGATEEDGDARPKWDKHRPPQRTGGGMNDFTAPQQQSKKPSFEEKPLHPSWEAARKAKEQKAQASYQGKKIVFD
jgi:hypothetical protein